MVKENLSKEKYLKIREDVKNCAEKFINYNGIKTLDNLIIEYNPYDKKTIEYSCFNSLLLFPDSKLFYSTFNEKFKSNASKMAKHYNIPLTMIAGRIYLINFYEKNFDDKFDIILDESNGSILDKHLSQLKFNKEIDQVINLVKK